ncbi:MAG: MFS transporter [Myxococcota bacterium]|nr:MFS transporter [Myxococcota bacterium]
MSAPSTDPSRARFEHVPLSSALLYGSATIPANMVGTCLGLHLYFFYTDSLGLAPLYLSAVMIVGSLWDAVSDQLMGQISDRTRWKAGRRRPYLLIAALPFGLAFLGVLAPPAALSGAALFVYLLTLRLLLYTAATMVYVPLFALAPEMAQTYHGRTRLTAFREAMGSVGDLIGMLAPPLLILALTQGGADEATASREGYARVGQLGLVLSVVFITAAFFGSYEDPSFARSGSVDLGAGLRELRTNRAFRKLVLAMVLPGTSVTIAGGLFLYLMKHVLGVGDPRFTSAAFVSYVAAALISFPMWAALARRFGKATAFRLATSLLTTGFLGVWLLEEGTLWRLFPIMAAVGAGNAGFWTTSFSQLADLADLDELASGARREGLFAGFASLIRKVGYAFGGGAIGVGLWAVGYDETASTQTPDTVAGLKLIFSLPSFALAMAGLWCFRGYPITEEVHLAAVDELAARRV